MVKEKTRYMNGKKDIPGGFIKAYHFFPKEVRWEIRNEVCAMCYWTIHTFKWKLSGRRPFRIYEIEVLEKLFAQKGINAWTGEPNNKN